MPLSGYKPDQYETLLGEKVTELAPRFKIYGEGDPAVFTSPSHEFRLRAEFRIWHSGDDLNYVMFRPDDPKTPVPVTDFPIAAASIRELMPRLLTAIRLVDRLRKKLFQIEFLSTLTGDMLVSLIYHRPLDEEWQTLASSLASELEIHIVGRSRKQKLVIGRDWVNESLTINGQVFHYQQPDQAFTQPNGHVNQAMISWARDCAEHCGGDLLELYCGIGNFTLPMADRFDRIIATELSKVAIAAADQNRVKNNIENIEFARLSAEDMTAALSGERPFRRLAHLHKPLAEYRLNTLLVDPPRAGLDDKTLNLASRFENIIYISCNPETLLENLSVLTASHRMQRLAFFDQFPYTGHMECGVFLQRRGS